MTTTIMRKLEFDAAHRVLGHEGKCRHLHGHRYVAEVSIRADSLDSLGRIVDFSVVKDLVGEWIDSNWDHNLILCQDDPQLIHLRKTEERKPYVMVGNPTAENLARELFDEASLILRILPELSAPLKVVRVVVWETPNCSATYEG